jgi:hypothetical protein
MALDLNTYVTNPKKGTTVTLFGGAIAASVTEANATAIDVRKYLGGSLDFLVNSGAGTFSLAIMTSETGTGVFHQLFKEKDDGTFISVPAIVTTTTVSASYAIKDIKANYIKFVPTLTSTCNATFTFTPSN